MSADTLNGTSFDKDGHEGTLSGISSSDVSKKEMHKFRLDFLKLVCEVTCRFHTVKKVASPTDKQCACSDQCDCTTNYNNGCDVQWDNGSVDSSHMSMSCGSSVSNHSDSTYHVPAGEDDEHDDSYNMYDTDSQSNSAHENARVDQDLSDRVTDDKDDGSVEEMYSDFKDDHERSWNNPHSVYEEIETDNLISPGDVLEYCTIDGDQTAKRCSVETIIDSEHESYLVLQNGTVLRPKAHSVRKIKFYDEYNHELIPNPLAEWHRLDKCILQSGSMNGDKECLEDDGDDGSDNATDEMDEGEVHIAHAQRHRHNKQRYGIRSIFFCKLQKFFITILFLLEALDANRTSGGGLVRV